MPVPKRRTTPSKRGMRRANHDKVTPPNVVPCANCSAPSLSHQVCRSCGYYAGRAVVAKKAAEEATGSAAPTGE